MVHSQRERLVRAASVFGPGVLAAVLTAYELPTRSLWLDESATFAISSQHGAALWAAMRHDGGNMLAFYAIIHVLMAAFGHSTTVLRLPSAVSAAVTATLLSMIGSRLWSWQVGAAAGVLCAVSFPFVYWGQDARGYAPMVALVTVSYYGFIALVDGERADGSGRPPRFAWPCYVLGLLLAAYMTFVAVLVVPAQLLALVWYRRRLRAVATGVVAVGVGCIPLVLIAHARGTGQLFWVSRPDAASSLGMLEALTSSWSFHRTPSSIPLLVLTLALLACTAGVALWRGRDAVPVDGVSRPRFAGVLVAAWLVVPPLLILIESLVGQSIYQPRYAVISLPPVALGLAWGALRTGLPLAIALGLIAVLTVLRGAQVVPAYGVSPEDWSGATSYVLSQSQTRDCIAFYPSDGRMAFQYYAANGDQVASGTPTPVLPTLPFERVAPFVETYRSLSPAEVSAIEARCPRLWFISSHVGNSRGTTESREHVARYIQLRDELLEAYEGPVTVRRFGFASPIYAQLFTR